MTVLVDDLKWFSGKQWSHMASDLGDTPAGLRELHALAAKIGMKRAWFQDREQLPHYDVQPRMRGLAIKAGAQAVDDFVFLKRCHERYRTEAKKK